jgi:hypothetical protein
MANAETTLRLRWHAGLEAGATGSDGSVSDCTSPDGDPGEIERAVSDVVATLSRLNQELNGPKPSSTITDPGVISTDIAYAVGEISRFLRKYSEVSGDPRGDEGAWTVDTAWLAVLAGDIDDVQQHVADEARAR